MDLDITQFFTEADAQDYSASRAELGDNAGTITWNAAKRAAGEWLWPLLDTDDKRDAFRAHVKGFGAWDETEIAAWSNEELNALLYQMIAGDMREGGLNTFKPDWATYEDDAARGTVAGRIFRGTDGRVYYYLGD